MFGMLLETCSKPKIKLHSIIPPPFAFGVKLAKSAFLFIQVKQACHFIEQTKNSINKGHLQPAVKAHFRVQPHLHYPLAQT
jgi:hypothetical protein